MTELSTLMEFEHDEGGSVVFRFKRPEGYSDRGPVNVVFAVCSMPPDMAELIAADIVACARRAREAQIANCEHIPHAHVVGGETYVSCCMCGLALDGKVMPAQFHGKSVAALIEEQRRRAGRA